MTLPGEGNLTTFIIDYCDVLRSLIEMEHFEANGVPNAGDAVRRMALTIKQQRNSIHAMQSDISQQNDLIDKLQKELEAAKAEIKELHPLKLAPDEYVDVTETATEQLLSELGHLKSVTKLTRGQLRRVHVTARAMLEALAFKEDVGAVKYANLPEGWCLTIGQNVYSAQVSAGEKAFQTNYRIVNPRLRRNSYSGSDLSNLVYQMIIDETLEL